MKKLLFSLLLSIPLLVVAQIQNPVHWAYTAKKINATTYEVHLTATIDAKWHVYSQTTPAGGPVPTTVTFTKNPLLGIDGQPKEVGKLQQKHEPLFGVDVKQFADKVDFVQVVKLKTPVKTDVTGNIEFMVCNDKECLPPKKIDFTVSLK